MNGIDILTRDVWDMPVAFAIESFDKHGSDYPISGDEIARISTEGGDDDGAFYCP